MHKPVTSTSTTDVMDDHDHKAVPSTTPTATDVMDDHEQRGALLRLSLVIVAGLVVAAFFGAFETVLVVLALLVMIVLHEFGHFVAAKRAGMKVSEFFVGFGPVFGP